MFENTTAMFNPFEQNRNIVKSYFSRKAVLVQGIAQLASILISTVISVLLIPTTMELMRLMATQLDAVSTSSFDYNTSFSPPSITVLLAGIAYIIIYVKCNSKKPNSSPKAGIMILYVLSIISLVFIIIACVALFAVLVLLGILLGIINNGEIDEFTGMEGIISAILIVCAVMIFITGVLTLIYSISKFRFFSSVKKSCEDVVLHNEGAKAYGVTNIIFAVFGGFGTLTGIISSLVFMAMPNLLRSTGNLYQNDIPVEYFYMIEKMPVLMILSGIVSAVSVFMYITEAVIALGYNRHINGIKNGYMPVGEMPGMHPTPFMPQGFNTQVEDSAPVQEPAPTQNIGAELTCPICHSKISPDDSFCGRCATRLK